MTAFKEMDKNKKGWVTAEDMASYFSINLGIHWSYTYLIKFWNDSEEDDRLTFNDWHRGVTGYALPYGYENHQDYVFANRG